ncbi:four helix bundle protein [Gemmata sp. G18]|uniref:Four helix bundle protein n=1 Tax=Gemmata palustris TaxID=2822762 RepID=A0ABS5BLH5_9BACT|nr:four helix bundle protein [Gemmata palustris]MBP3954565.1 four helix bundle protein [Gemmata palustris]
MAKIERFEDIDAWKRARVLTSRVYATTNAGAFARDFGLRDQIRRACVSIMSNIAEGFERGAGDKEFARFLSIAKGSAGEVRAQLYVALDVGYLTQSEFEEHTQLATEISRLLSRFMQYLTTTS